MILLTIASDDQDACINQIYTKENNRERLKKLLNVHK